MDLPDILYELRNNCYSRWTEFAHLSTLHNPLPLSTFEVAMSSQSAQQDAP